MIALYVVGSCAREARKWLDGAGVDFKSGADVDLGVRITPGTIWSAKQKVRFTLTMETLMVCQRVDQVVLQDADPFLAVEIIREERLYTRDESEADEYDLFILQRAGDLAHLERERPALSLKKKRDPRHNSRRVVVDRLYTVAGLFPDIRS